MIHVQYTPVTGRAVVASIRLEHMTHQAIPPPFVFRVAHEKPSIRRHLARIGEDCLEEGSQEHEEESVENMEQETGLRAKHLPLNYPSVWI